MVAGEIGLSFQRVMQLAVDADTKREIALIPTRWMEVIVLEKLDCTKTVPLVHVSQLFHLDQVFYLTPLEWDNTLIANFGHFYFGN